MDASVMAVLERAELAARESRLAAAETAEQLLDEARRRAAAIEAGTSDRMAAALDLLHARHRVQADAEIEAITTELAAFERQASPVTGPDPRFERAVDLIVAAVLGEAAPGAVPAGRSAAAAAPGGR